MSTQMHVKFELDKEVDKFMAAKFLEYSRDNIEYSEGVWGPHPKLKDISASDIHTIDNYFNQFYEDYLDILNDKIKNFTDEWNVVEKRFINAVRNLFNGFHFPKGDYIGYVSIINCNPRFLETSSFQIFYESKSAIPITSHELMHFIFYAYITKNATKEGKDIIESSGLWWTISEVFNNVILGSKDFVELLRGKFEEPHPGHHQYFEHAKHIYDKSENIDQFIEGLYRYLKTESNKS